ncbi:MAG: DUF3576 domain-containing protein [Pseudomonadota bacterium]
MGATKLLGLLALMALSACSTIESIVPFAGASSDGPPTEQAVRVRGGDTVAVNRYIWNASLDVLSFLPIETVDPFTGVIVTGFGTPPGGSRAYRATVLVNDPALDARSLKVSLVTRAGPASPDTVRAVEDAILTRARQLRSGNVEAQR